MDLVLNNLQGLIYHKTQTTNQPSNDRTLEAEKQQDVHMFSVVKRRHVWETG